MKKNIFALLIFVFLTAVMTYPAVLRMENHITGDLRDSLHATWILSWDILKFRTGISGYWDANFFYPYNLTLTFSEHLTGIAIFGLPIMLLTNNILFTYNFLLLLTFILSAFGTYLLVKHLTENFWSGIISGIIFTFVSFRFGQIPHLNILNAQWISFGLLYLHKFFEKFNSKHIALFALFYVLQCISSLHNGLFMSILVGFFLIFYIIQKKITDKKIFLKIFLVFIFIAIVLLPFTYPYLKAKKQFGFHKRGISQTKEYSAHIESYFSANQTNWIYGKLTHKMRRHGGKGSVERELFVGLVALFLAFIGFWPERIKVIQTKISKKNIFLTIWFILTTFYSLIVIVFLFTGGEPICLFGKEIFEHTQIKPITILTLLFIVRWCLDKSLREKIKNTVESINQNERFYFLMTILMVFLSFGPQILFFKESSIPGPYFFLYYLAPGFGSIRVTSRFAVIVFLGVSVLAGYGYKKLLQKFDSHIKKVILGTSLIMLSLVEYLSIPLSTPALKIGKNIPTVYKWLSQQKGDSPVIEFPLHKIYSDYHKEVIYLYYSSYHWKRILNGHSSYASPIYAFLTTQLDKFPSTMFLNLLKTLGIKYMIIHSDEYEKSEWQEIRNKLTKYSNKISFVGKFESDFVYQIVNSSFTLLRPEEPNPNLLICKERWRAQSNINNKNVHNAIDNTLRLRWDTAGPRRPGAYFQLDLCKTYEFNRIWLSLGNKYNDYPENYALEVSDDNKNWKVVISEENISPKSYLASLFYSPKNVKICIKFDAQKARYIRITQHGEHEEYWWVIYEIDVQRVS